MNYADLRPMDATNGLGIGTTLFVSGCNFKCKDCFNEEAQDFNYNKEFTKYIENKFINYAKNKHINHVSLLGGEVFHQDLQTMYNLVLRIKDEVNKTLWVWSGYTFEELLKDKDRFKILQYIDILVDGRFEIDKKDISLKFRGSSNQRIINVQESIKQNKVILWNGGDY